MKSIRTRLLIGLLLGSLVCTLAAALILFRLADNEADEQSDLRLRQVAWAMPLHLGTDVRAAATADLDDGVQVQIWDGHGLPEYRLEAVPDLPRLLLKGYRTIRFAGEPWRVYTDVRDGHFIQVSQPIAERQRVAAHMVLRMSPPLLLLIPALALLIWFVVGRALAPLERLAQALRGRAPGALQALATQGLSPDLLPIVASVNTLLEKIEHAMALQSTFIADAAHELRSPLTALKLHLQLAERAGSDALRAVSFRKLHERLDRSTHLVQQLLTLARHEQVHAAPVRQSQNLLELAQEVVADHAIHAESKQIDLGMVTTTAVSVVAQVHAEGIMILLGNLVDNAVRYTPNGGQVDVSAGMMGGRPYLRVADNGPGVPEPERSRLFDRFYRPDGNAVWGCGLGMSIVKSVADEHDAAIELAGNAGGRGLVVTLILPQQTQMATTVDPAAI